MTSEQTFFILPDGSCSGLPRRKSPRRGPPGRSYRSPYLSVVGAEQRSLDWEDSEDFLPSHPSSAASPREAASNEELLPSLGKRPGWRAAVDRRPAHPTAEELDPWAAAEMTSVQEMLDGYSDYGAKLMQRLANGRRFGVLVPRPSPGRRGSTKGTTSGAQSARSSTGQRRRSSVGAGRRPSLSPPRRSSVVRRPRPTMMARSFRLALPGMLPGAKSELPTTPTPGESRPSSSAGKVPADASATPAGLRPTLVVPSSPSSLSSRKGTKESLSQSSFTKFLARQSSSSPRERAVRLSDVRGMASAEREKENRRKSGGSHHEGEPAAPKSLQGKTAVIVDSLHSWLRRDSGGAYPNKSGTGDANAEGEHERELGHMVRSLYGLARKHGCTITLVHETWKEFCEYDARGLGYINNKQFEDLIRRRACLPEGELIPQHLLGMLNPEKGEMPRVDFESYLAWSISVQWTEEMQVNPEEREIRRIARDHQMMLIDIERFKSLFDKYDTDGSGEIEEAEFRDMIYEMWNVKDQRDLPLNRLKRFWHELDTDGSGSVNFEEFVVWYRNMNMDATKDFYKKRATTAAPTSARPKEPA